MKNDIILDCGLGKQPIEEIENALIVCKHVNQEGFHQFYIGDVIVAGVFEVGVGNTTNGNIILYEKIYDILSIAQIESVFFKKEYCIAP